MFVPRRFLLRIAYLDRVSELFYLNFAVKRYRIAVDGQVSVANSIQ